MDRGYLDYLALLDEVSGCIGQLSALANRKTAAVRRDDVAALNQVMKEEQALSLALRGLEQRRSDQLKALGLGGVPLRDLALRYPPELALRAAAAAERLQKEFQLYCSAAEVARHTLECNLHEIEKSLSGAGGAAGPGYAPPDAQPPDTMKTDFRA